jgi:hypothetical protein
MVEREAWFTWPRREPAAALEVRLTSQDVKWLRNDFAFGDPREYINKPIVKGFPDDAPVWLQQIYPSIVWTRVVPAVVLDLLCREALEAAPTVEVTDWVLSDRRPEALSRTTPTWDARGWKPPAWSW